MENNFRKKIEMNTFLTQMQTLFIKNNLTESDIKRIYAHLVTVGIPEREKRQDLSDAFNILQNYNQNNEKMKVFVANHWKYFCQFVSKNSNKAFGMNPIKLYIPLKKQNIERNVQKIFDFINENNIEHLSKLARETRVDDLVIRVMNKEDADKIINFVNNDLELTNDMYEPNPFCITEGKVGLAMDRSLSYNDTVAKYIFHYVKEETERKNIVSYEGFVNYIQRNLHSLKTKKDLSEQINKFADNEDLYKLPTYLQNLEEVTTVILKNLEGQPKEVLYQEFEKQNSMEYLESQANEYDEFDYTKMYTENNRLLQQVVTTMNEKYGEHIARINIKKYKETGYSGVITRTNNLRDIVDNSKTFRTYLGLINIDREIDILLPKRNEDSVLEAKPSKEMMLEISCKETYLRAVERDYDGQNQVAMALINASKYGDYQWFTRTNNARSQVQENISPEEFEDIIRRSLEANGYIIENDIDLYELYANHIDYLCNNNEVKRGR